jgi:hypothetical protein
MQVAFVGFFMVIEGSGMEDRRSKELVDDSVDARACTATLCSSELPQGLVFSDGGLFRAHSHLVSPERLRVIVGGAKAALSPIRSFRTWL